MAKNEAGGYGFVVKPETFVKRFLLLSRAGGTYYLSESDDADMQRDNLLKILHEDPELVASICASERWKLPKLQNLFMLYALGTVRHPEVFYKYFDDVIINLSNLFYFLKYRFQFKKSFGSGLRKRISAFLQKLADKGQLDYQLAKYRQREGVGFWDVLNLAHPKTYLLGERNEKLVQHIMKGLELPDEAKEFAPYNWARQVANKTQDEEQIISLINEYELGREMLPTWALNSRAVWEAMLRNDAVPYVAMLRNLRNMAEYGVLESEEMKEIISAKIKDPITHKIHPFQILLALASIYKTYAGRQRNWLVNLLNDAYLLSFKAEGIPHYRSLIGVDVSGSMTWKSVVAGLDNFELAFAIARVLYGYNPEGTKVMAFSNTFKEVLPQVFDKPIVEDKRWPFSRTDCSLPVLYAMEKEIHTDVFIVITDNETWHGKLHPAEAIQQYRQKFNPNAKMVVIGLEAIRTSIADPQDPGMLDLEGASPDLVQVIDYFVQEV